MQSRVTLKDIAAATGLSVSAVSLALRGDKRFPRETLDRVNAAARELGYIYNQAAADLRKSRSDTIAVCLGDLSNPVFNDMLIAAERHIDDLGKRLMLGVTRESKARQADFLHQALRAGCEAILICPAYGTTREDLDQILIRAGQLIVPTALFFRSVEGFAAPQVVNDEFRAGQLAAEAALNAGHRRLYWLGGGQQTSAARQRQAGALAAIRTAGLEPIAIESGATSRAFGYEIATRILERDRSPDIALLCFSDLIALGVLSACHAMKRAVGHDLSVIGCDDMQEVRYAVPPLSTVRIDIGSVISWAVQAVASGKTNETKVFEPQLILRESIAALERI